MDKLEEIQFHLKHLERIRQEKKLQGKQPLSDINTAKHTASRYDKLRKILKKERKKEILVHPERKIVNMGERHRQPMRCVETGETFHSMTQLAKHLGLSVATVHIQVERGRKLKGYTYIKIDKNEE